MSDEEYTSKYHHFSSPSDLKFYFTEIANYSLWDPNIIENYEHYWRLTEKDLQGPRDHVIRIKNEKTKNVSSEYNPENILSDINKNHILKLEFQNAENYKISFNLSSDLPYPYWVNGNSIKSASQFKRFYKPDRKKVMNVINSERKDPEYKNKISSSPAFPIFVKLANVAKLVINSYKKKLFSLKRFSRGYLPVTNKQLLTLTSLLASILLFAFL